MSVLNVKPEFLYPHLRQFPFDEVSEKIVRALQKRNWQVPEIEVEFHTYGTGELKYKMVSSITGEKFKLHFCRIQGKLCGPWNDIAAVETINIPMQQLTVYEDDSGPTYCLYVGENWNKDKSWFMNSIKRNSKLNNEPKRYLRYEGRISEEGVKQLVNTTDLDREYAPERNEPKTISLSKKYNEFTNWLKNNVLDYILTFPEQEEQEEKVELIPYKGPWPVVFSICDNKEAERLLKGKMDKSKLPLEDRHAYFGSGYRVVPLSIRENKKIPEIAYDGFIWCDVNQKITQETTCKDLSQEISSRMGNLFRDNCVVAIKPKYSNGIFVIDNAKYTQTREELFSTIAPRDRLTDEEYDTVLTARGATIIPITEYKGDYKDPIFLINRELDFDEIEWVGEYRK